MAAVVGSCGVVWATTKNKSVLSLCEMDWLVELSINERAGLQKNGDVEMYSKVKLETLLQLKQCKCLINTYLTKRRIILVITPL